MHHVDTISSVVCWNDSTLLFGFAEQCHPNRWVSRHFFRYQLPCPVIWSSPPNRWVLGSRFLSAALMLGAWHQACLTYHVWCRASGQQALLARPRDGPRSPPKLTSWLIRRTMHDFSRSGSFTRDVLTQPCGMLGMNGAREMHGWPCGQVTPRLKRGTHQPFFGSSLHTLSLQAKILFFSLELQSTFFFSSHLLDRQSVFPDPTTGQALTWVFSVHVFYSGQHLGFKWSSSYAPPLRTLLEAQMGNSGEASPTFFVCA